MRTLRMMFVIGAVAGAAAGCEGIYQRDITATVTGPATVKVGEVVLLTARLDYSDGTNEILSPATSSAVIWNSSDISIATVNGFGAVTGVAAGTVTITATPSPFTTDGKRTPGNHSMTVVP